MHLLCVVLMIRRKGMAQVEFNNDVDGMASFVVEGEEYSEGWGKCNCTGCRIEENGYK